MQHVPDVHYTSLPPRNLISFSSFKFEISTPASLLRLMQLAQFQLACSLSIHTTVWNGKINLLLCRKSFSKEVSYM